MRSTLGKAVVVAVCLSWVAAGCSRAHYRKSADREVYGIVKAGSAQVPGMLKDFDVEPYRGDILEKRPAAPAGAETPEPAAAGAPPAEKTVVISLAKALEIAALNSRDYQNQKESLYLSALSLTFQRFQFAPRFSGTLSGDYTFTGVDNDQEASADSSFGFSWLFNTGTELSVSLATSLSKFLTGSPRSAASSFLSVAVTQPLLRGAGISVTEPLVQAERNVIYEIRRFVHYRRIFFVSVLSGYFRVLQNRQVVENEEVNYKNQDLLRERAEAWGEANRMDGVQVDQIRQAVLAAENSVVRAKQSYESSLDAFKITLGLPTACKLELDPTELANLREAGVVEVDVPEERLIEVGLSHRLDLMTARDKVDDAARKVEVAANDLLPGLDLSAQLGAGTEDGKPLKFSQDATDISLGLELDLPLDRLSERNSYRERLIDQERAERDHADQRDRVVQQVRDAWRQYVQARQSYTIQKASVELAERRVDSTMMLLEAGRKEARDLLDAQQSLLGAQNSMARALVDYRAASLELARDMDILEVDENGQMKETFDEFKD
jgi:outer membrane protein TolC